VQVPFTITGEDGGGEFVGTIEVGAKTVSAGKNLTVTGADFEPGETVAISLESKKGKVIELGTTVVNGDGTFHSSVMVPKKTEAGKYTVIVAQEDGDQATGTVTVNRGNGGGVIRDILDWLWDLITGWF
jgi:5'-nucleotidase